LYFTPASGANSYYISYGTDSSANQFGTSFSYTNSSGAISHIIGSLTSGTTYYFKVRGGNNCAAGNWSSVKSATTTAASSQNLISNIGNTVKSMLVPKDDLNIISSDLTTKKSNVCSYTVQSGDSFWTISEDKLELGTRFTEIKKLNNLSSDALLVRSLSFLVMKARNQPRKPKKNWLKRE
jgi:hypothetical protein